MRSICSSQLRSFASSAWLSKMKDPVLIVNGREKLPVAVLVPYGVWEQWRDILSVDLAKFLEERPEFAELREALRALSGEHDYSQLKQ